jgi:hypothetical protein
VKRNKEAKEAAVKNEKEAKLMAVQMEKEAKAANATGPIEEQRVGSGGVSVAEQNKEAKAPKKAEKLLPCPTCGRSFAKEPLEKHKKICKKVCVCVCVNLREYVVSH